jgi:hypothetical protein
MQSRKVKNVASLDMNLWEYAAGLISRLHYVG